MGAGENRPSKGSARPEGDVAGGAPFVRRDERTFTPAKGSDGIASDDVKSPPAELDDKRTRKMEAEEFRALLQGARGPRAPTIPAANEVMQELVAKTIETDDDDLAIPVAPADAKPAKQPALIVPDHRLETRHAGGIAPITRPPSVGDAPPTDMPRPGAPSSTKLIVLLGLLAVAIAVALAVLG